MIPVANSAEYFINEFTQEIYDQVLDHVDFKSLECSCGAKGSFVKIGCYPRFYKTATNKICIRIQRVMCKHCGKTHAVFVECMVPSSMLLLTTQIEMLRSYYNHRLEEFLSSYPTIDRPNAIYVIKNYERKWVNYLKKSGFTLKSKEREIQRYFFEKYQVQFLQMKCFSNSSSSRLLNHLV